MMLFSVARGILLFCLCIVLFILLGSAQSSNGNAARPSPALVGHFDHTIRQKRERARATDEEVCQLMALNIPGLCMMLRKTLLWLMNNENFASYVGTVCWSTVQINQKGRRRRQIKSSQSQRSAGIRPESNWMVSRFRRHANHSEHDDDVFYDAKEFAFSEEEFYDALDEFDDGKQLHAKPAFSNVELHEFFNSYAHNGSELAGKQIQTSVRAKTVCQKMVAATAKFCRQLVGETVANHIRDFAWVCLFVRIPDPLGMCYGAVRQLGRICRAELGEDLPHGTEPGEYGSVQPQKPVSIALLSPLQTCKSFIPTFGTLCANFRYIFKRIFGAKIEYELGRSCAVIMDGLRHVKPTVKQALASTKLDSKTIQSQHSNNEVSVNSRALEVCTNVMTTLAGWCHNVLGRFSGSLNNLLGLCVFTGVLNGECRYVVAQLAGICRTDARFLACDSSSTAATAGNSFSCWKRKEGFYADPAHPACASYYFHCAGEGWAPLVSVCTEGSNYVFVEKEQRCKKKSDIVQCHNIKSPCIPDAAVIAETSKPTHPTVNPAHKNPVPTHTKPDPGSFSCAGKQPGAYANTAAPHSSCSRFYFVCTKQSSAALVEDCNGVLGDSAERIFDPQTMSCVPLTEICLIDEGQCPKECSKH